MAGGDGFWLPLPSTSTGAALQLLHVRDQKTTGTQGGSSSSSAWNARDLNTVAANDITGASLASNSVTLPAGTYKAHITVPSFRSGAVQARLRNVTTGTTVLVGSSAHSDASAGSNVLSVIVGRFTLAATSTLQVQQYHENSTATFGLGHRGSIGNGEVEVYTDVVIEDVS